MNISGRKNPRQQGLSIIELLVAMTISIALVGGVLQVFSNTQSTYRTHESFARVSENIQFALDLMTQDINMADFWGCNPVAISMNNAESGDNQLNSNAGPAFIDFASDGPTGTGGGLTGTDGDETASGLPDLITIRGLTGTPSRILPQAESYLPIVLQEPNTNLITDQIVAISDCERTDFFQITSVSANGTTISHDANTGQPPQNKQGNLSKAYREDSALYRAQQITYFLQPGANNRLALWRNLNNSPVEIVPNIEDLQFKYGEDTTGDLVIDRYVDANAPDINFANVLSIRVTIVATSDEDNVSVASRIDSGGNTDHRIEKTVTTTIAMKNRLP